MNQRDVYTHGHQPAVVAQHSLRTAESCAGYLLPHIKADHNVLDVGCGPGSISVGLARAVPAGSVHAIDIAEAVLDTARAAALDAGVTNVEFDTGDVYALTAEEGQYDIVHAHQVLQHVTRPVDALREMRRVTRSGGKVGVRDADYGSFIHAPTDPALDAWLTMYRAVARANHAEPDAGRHLLAWCSTAGFTDVEITSETWTFAEEANRINWGDSWADRTLNTTFGAQAIEYGIASRSDLEHMADAWRRWARDPHGVYLLTHVAALATV
jgi:ubiquinone/menaquinone biosynthesis C-methylase UbiE